MGIRTCVGVNEYACVHTCVGLYVCACVRTCVGVTMYACVRTCVAINQFEMTLMLLLRKSAIPRAALISLTVILLEILQMYETLASNQTIVHMFVLNILMPAQTLYILDILIA